MDSVFNWLSERWRDVVVPSATFFAVLVAILWVRRIALAAFDRWLTKVGLSEKGALVRAWRRASIWWSLIISVYAGLAVSMVPEGWKGTGSNILSSVFIVSLAFLAARLGNIFIPLYGEKLNAPKPAVRIAGIVLRVTVLVLTLLTLLDLWGAPTSPILLLVGVAILVAALTFRNAIPNWAAGFNLTASGRVNVGDYIKLGGGEEGYVRSISWSTIELIAPGEMLVSVPNRKFLESTVINYGRPLKQATAPFRFYTRTHLTELTGQKAGNLREMIDILKQAPDTMVYYHTHHFLEEHHFLSPEPANDFALWVSDALGDEVLGERLAAVDTFEFASLGVLRERLTSIMEESVARGNGQRAVLEGREFYFMKSMSFVLPTPYMAHDLREFIEALRKLSVSSLYFHIFESRLRLGRGLNDFSVWLRDSMDEEELAEKVARLDPYTYTLEGLRSTLIQLIEKRIK
ncbi:MAG: mechanosensitive ion channel [Chloroflexi bacterium]|nr:mechanosensitive ion channel [Chloroflexota bacterium]